MLTSGKYSVYLVLIHNRWDCCEQRINGAEVWVDNYKCGVIKYKRGSTMFPIKCGGRTGRIVKVKQRNDYLSLAEVQVFGTGGNGLSVPNFGTGNLKLLSFEKAASQSSTKGHWKAYLAVNGIEDRGTFR